MKTYIEEREELTVSVTDAVNMLLDDDRIDWNGLPDSKKRKILARALVSNCIIDEIAAQIEYLITGSLG